MLILCKPRDTETIPQPSYIMVQQGNRFICEVLLPEISPIVSATGFLSSRKATAKRSAAFEACVGLIKSGDLDENLLSTYEKRLPAMRNALLALDERRKAVYERLTKPALWSLHFYTPSELFLSVFQVNGPQNLSWEYQPMAILTRTPMPEIPDFPIHIKFDAAFSIKTISLKIGLEMTEKILALLTGVTARFFLDVFNKIYVEDDSRRPYWVVPIKQQFSAQSDILPADAIDWGIVDAISRDEKICWNKNTSNSQLEGRFFVDPNSGAHRYFSVLVSNLRAFDPLPMEDGLKRPHKGNLIIEQCSGLWKRSKENLSSTANPNQPVLLAHMVNLQRNWLDKSPNPESPSKCYICPEPLRISPVSFLFPGHLRDSRLQFPVPFAKTAFIFPSIMFRFDSYLIALEAFGKLQLKVDPHLALEAMTKDSDTTQDPEKDQIRFQKGMGPNYERLEFLGDCFLKMAVSISIYARQPQDSEYFMHCSRMTLICNLNLRGNAIDSELFKYIRSKGFSR